MCLLLIRKGDFLQQHFQYFSFTPNHEKNFRTFGQNYLKQRHFELFPKPEGFYSLRFFSEVRSGSGQNGPDPPTLVVGDGRYLLLKE
jgi:hypothetical protein